MPSSKNYLVSSLKNTVTPSPALCLSSRAGRATQGRVERSTRSDFAFISHRFALIAPPARVGWGPARLVEMTNHAAPSPSVLLTFLRSDTRFR